MSGTTAPSSAPVLSTPEDGQLFEPAAKIATAKSTMPEEALRRIYEIDRTTEELRAGGWQRIALQFPDDMLTDAPRVAETLGAGLSDDGRKKIYILGDTSYSACCVDEVAAEHADAQVVVHYGRACLSPTSRLPVIYVYTSRELDVAAVAERFEAEFPDRQTTRAVIMADLMYQHHVTPLVDELVARRGYKDILGTEVVRDPNGLVPNRTVACASADELKAYSLFHVSDPSPSVLLSLHSRFASLHVLETSKDTLALDNPTMHTAGLLRRRFARVLSLASAGVIGILVNTLSVADSLASVATLRKACHAAGKKTYTVVVGRLNPAKLANFAEVEGWVVIGCWESGLIDEDQGGGYWRPVATPFEMEVALMDESHRIWSGEWWGGIEKLKLDGSGNYTNGTYGANGSAEVKEGGGGGGGDRHIDVREDDDEDDEEESQPPEYDLRTGKLVSHSRPMRLAVRSRKKISSDGKPKDKTSSSLIKVARSGEIASINGVISPGAEFLRSQRTWQGLGTDFADDEDRRDETSTLVEEGRSGLARGYRVGEAAAGAGRH
ncbi:diphthamide biosynthesis protein 2 [Geosmithia morbida]|uniref:2-(3-amino-3-carboxypropyl)histidine synthase subunit 2 n=1 Tax=Geosmithia morbida TaxID=1094350 RepID=A0A9P4YRJ7_9HYPO|nr:diphthamide biosynthesis protein 2 [Geosmithia morbida]KAF4120403.1 diphthamide biosynthesis protein 2 [Geosmithia morbida]